MKGSRYDVLVIGATRAGIAAVSTALARGLSVALVDTDPASRLAERHCAELRHRTSALRGALGDMKDSANLFREAVRQIWGELASSAWRATHRPVLDPSMKSLECDVFDGPIRLLSATEVELADQMCLSSNAIVIATGASPRHPKFFDFSKDSICDVQELVRNQDPPRSITIVGADWTGCEWAFVCASTGAEVTLVDRRSRMLRAVDSEVRGVLQSSLIEMGVDVVLCEKIADWSLGSHGECQIKLGSGRIQVSERLLVLEGQCGNIAGLGLGELGVQTDDHDHIAVDDDYQSSVKGIFAIGAVSDPQGLGHAASLQAEIAVASVVGDSSRDFPYDPAWTLYSATEIALCGLTQEACETLGLETVAATAVSEESTGRSSRLAKVVVNASTGRMVGVQLAGPGAPEAIGLAADLVGREAHIRECVRVSGPDGTLAGLCAQAFRLALAELKAGRFGTEWSDVSQ